MASTPDLSSIFEVASCDSVTYTKWSAPNKDHLIWYQSFGSWYRFYPIRHFFPSYFDVSFSVHVFVLVLVSFRFYANKICLNSVSSSITNSVCGQFGLLEEFRGLGFSRFLNLFSYWMNCVNYPRQIWKESIIKKRLQKVWKKNKERKWVFDLWMWIWGS